MSTLTDSFLKELVAALDNPNTVGVAMTGSHARGEGGQYSDVDIHQYVRQMPDNPAEIAYLRFMDGILVSVSLTSLDEAYANLRNPKKAVWAIPGLRQLRILLDKDGSIAILKETAEKTEWQPMQAAANAYASRTLSGSAEEIHKILAGLAQRNESKTLYAIWGLTYALANLLIVQRGLLIQTENVFIDLAQEAAGRTSEWTRQFRLSIGLDLIPLEEPAYIGYGIAGLCLYRETAGLLQNILLPDDAVVVDRTIANIAEAGY
jgi:hypothetical protein